MSKIIIYLCFSLILFSCNAKKISVCNNVENEEIIHCGGSYNETILEVRRPISTVAIISIVKNSDTTLLENLIMSDTILEDGMICSDSITFRETIISSINFNEDCINQGLQGKSYYSVKINHVGSFESLKVLRNPESCLDEIDSQIKRKLEKTRVRSEKYFNYNLVFYHQTSIR